MVEEYKGLDDIAESAGITKRMAEEVYDHVKGTVGEGSVMEYIGMVIGAALKPNMDYKTALEFFDLAVDTLYHDLEREEKAQIYDFRLDSERISENFSEFVRLETENSEKYCYIEDSVIAAEFESMMERVYR